MVDWWEIFQPKWWDVEIGPRSGIIETFQERYGFLKKIKTLKTLHVSWMRGGEYWLESGVEIKTEVVLGENAEDDKAVDELGLVGPQFMLDLCDNDQIRQVVGLGLTKVDLLNAQDLCFYYEQKDWYDIYKNRADKCWLLLSANELETEEEWMAIFAPLTRPLDYTNEWVQKKLQGAPTFRPYVRCEVGMYEYLCRRTGEGSGYYRVGSWQWRKVREWQREIKAMESSGDGDEGAVLRQTWHYDNDPTTTHMQACLAESTTNQITQTGDASTGTSTINTRNCRPCKTSSRQSCTRSGSIPQRAMYVSTVASSSSDTVATL